MSETTKFVLNAAAVVVIAAVAIRLLFMEVVVVRNNGMAPTLVYGDEVLVWKGAKMDMADVMACEHPARSGELVFGRAVAFAGHTIRADYNGMLYVDNDRTTTQIDTRLRFYDVAHKRLWDMQHGRIDYFGRHGHAFFLAHQDLFRMETHTVESGAYLLGDNRSDSNNDSREYGEVKPGNCLGQVIMRLKPGPARGDELKTGYLDVIE